MQNAEYERFQIDWIRVKLDSWIILQEMYYS